MPRNGGRIGIKNSPTSSSASGIFCLSEAFNEIKNGTWPEVLYPPPITSGLFAWYTASSFNGTSWNDLSGNGRNATTTGVSKVSSSGNGASKTFDTLQGNTSSMVTWPSGVLPSTYTLFHVTRYTGGTRGRIYTGSNNNWLSGFWSSKSGLAYHEGWLTQTSTDVHGNNWVISTDQNSLYRSNGVTRGSSGGSASTNLTINFNEQSDWQTTEAIVYNRTLSSTEYQQVEAWLSSKYGITI